MTLRDALDFALTSLRGNLAKSLLTVLGLGVGVGAVLTVLSLGDAGEIRVEEEIARLGVDKVWFCAENPAYPLTEDCRAIAASTGADVCLGASTMDAVSLGGQTVYAQIAGYDDGLEAVHHPSSVQVGGLLGILLGLGMTALFGALIGLMPQVKWLHMGLLLAGAAVLGLSFGVIPAAKAAGLPPAQALRTE